MPCTVTTNTPANRIKSFSASYVLNGAFSATVTFTDTECIDGPGCNDLCEPIQVSIDSDIEAVCCGTDTLSTAVSDCYDVSPIWVNGLMRSFTRSNTDATSTVTVSSYFEHLNAKPINTQQFYGADLSDVLDIVFRYYTGTPDALRCINSFNNAKIKGPIEGNSSMQELLMLAQVGCANLFTQVGGCLTIERWKDNTDPTDFVIPPELIISAEPAEYKRSNTTVIRARGASLSKKDCGETPLTNNNLGPGPVKQCVIIGITSPCATITHNNLTGSREDILAGREISPDANRVGPKKDIKDGTYAGEYVKSDGSFFGPTQSELNFLLVGAGQSTTDEGIYGYYYGPGGAAGYGGNKSFFNSLPQWLAGNFPVPFSNFGLGAFGSFPFTNGGEPDSDYYSDQQSFQQCEIVASSPQIEECGIKYEEINNKYIPCKEHLFKMAIRRFQEIQLSENTWNVKLPYVPCLELNQMVEFTVPCTEDCPVQVVKGIVGGINIDFASDENGIECTTMSVTIMDVSCLGQTEYTSGNLVQSICAGENSTDLNAYQTSALGIDSTATVTGGSLFMATIGSGMAFANYTHSEMTPGCTYNWSFEYETFSGASTVSFSAPITTLGTFNGTGTRSGTFVQPVGQTTGTWTFNMPGFGLRTYIVIRNLRIEKVVIA